MSNLKILDYFIGTIIENEFGKFKSGSFLISNEGKITNNFVLIKDIKQPLPLRIQSGCLTGNIFHDQHCECRIELINSIKIINEKKNGIIIYTPEHDGKGKGITNKLRVYKLKQDYSITSEEACKRLGLAFDIRDYLPIVEILKYFRIKRILLISNSRNKLAFLKDSGFEAAYYNG